MSEIPLHKYTCTCNPENLKRMHTSVQTVLLDPTFSPGP